MRLKTRKLVRLATEPDAKVDCQKVVRLLIPYNEVSGYTGKEDPSLIPCQEIKLNLGYNGHIWRSTES